MLQEQNKNLSLSSHNPSPDVQQSELQLQREAQDQHRRASSVFHWQIQPKMSCSRNQLVSPLSLAASSVWVSPWLENLLSSRFRAGVLHCQHLHHAGSIPLCLDFQVGESSGHICSSPSLIIPVVIIPLNSRQLEGKKIPHLSTAREQEVQGVPGEQQGQAVLRVLPSPSLQTRLQRVHSSVPALPVLPGWEVLHTP